MNELTNETLQSASKVLVVSDIIFKNSVIAGFCGLLTASPINLIGSGGAEKLSGNRFRVLGS